MSWDRRFGRMEGLPNGRIGDYPRHPREGAAPGTSPKARYDGAEARVAMRVVIEKAGGRGSIELAQLGMFRSIRRSSGLKGDSNRSPAPPKERK